LALINAGASFCLAMMAPIIGALCDLGGLKKIFLGFFASLGIIATGLLFFVEKGEWSSAAFLYVAASVGFFAGNNLYDSLR
jgi:UMF1 family MFS transporter